MAYLEGAKPLTAKNASGRREGSVLLIEDDPELAEQVRLELEAAGRSPSGSLSASRMDSERRVRAGPRFWWSTGC